jgi:hypothetical protein
MMHMAVITHAFTFVFAYLADAMIFFSEGGEPDAFVNGRGGGLK